MTLDQLLEAREALLSSVPLKSSHDSGGATDNRCTRYNHVVPVDFETLAGDDAEVNECLREMLIGPAHRALPVCAKSVNVGGSFSWK